MTEKGEFWKLSAIRRCPLCSGELERGYIPTTHRISWDTKKHSWFARGKEALVIEGDTIDMTVRNVPALRCVKCRIVVFDYELK
jgi:hypothetical protein